MGRHTGLLLILAIATAPWLSAQHPSFRLFSTDDGLVRNWVTRIHRDSKGYLWFCTVEGISLFDGYRFANFSTLDGLPSRLVSDMVETQSGEIWFSTLAGLARFHNRHGNTPAFDAIQVGDTKESNNVQVLYQGHDGTIWCGTAAGLYSFRPQNGERRPRVTPLNAPGPVEVLALAEDSRQNLWVATPRALLRRRPGGEIDSLPIPRTISRIDSMLVDGHDRLWAGGFGVAGIDTKTEPPRLLPRDCLPRQIPERIAVFHEGERGEIWIGGSTGLIRFRPDASPPDVAVYKTSDAFPVDHVLAIEEDIRHNLWLAVGTRGAIQIAEGLFELYTRADGLDSNEVYGLAESLRGDLYAITGQWTLNELRGQRFTPIPLRVPRPRSTWALGQTVVQDRGDPGGRQPATAWLGMPSPGIRANCGGSFPSVSIPFETACPVRWFCGFSAIRETTFGPVPPTAWAIGIVPRAAGGPFELPTSFQEPRPPQLYIRSRKIPPEMCGPACTRAA